MSHRFPALLSLAAAALLLAAPPVGAHSDTGKISVIAAEQTGPTTVHLEIGLVYDNDGDLAEEASVTAELAGPDGERLGPIDLPRIAGARYGADVELPAPGAWTVTFNASQPRAEATATVEVTEATPTTAEVSEDPGASVPTDDDATAATEDDDSSAAPVVVVVLVAGALAAAAFYVVRARRHS